MPLDSGRTIDARGEAHQSSLRKTAASQATLNLTKPVLGIVLRTYTADMGRNLMSHYFKDRHGFAAVAEVLITNDGEQHRITNVMILPSHPGGLDNFEENLPRASSKYVNGEDFDSASHENDTHDLDGDWCIVSFVEGNINVPYISNWWPHPRNTFDPQTSGEGHPNSEGVGKALQQCKNGRGRIFSRKNGVEHVITENGDQFFSTTYAGSDLTSFAEAASTNGRFPRVLNPNVGGGIRVNIKTVKALELNWNEEEDGIGLGDLHDPGLPQTNPPQTTPFTKTGKNALFIRLQNKSAIFETPSMFSVQSAGQISLVAVDDIVINSTGSGLIVSANATMDTVVVDDITVTCTTGNINTITRAGDITFTADEGEAKIQAKNEITLISDENDIIISAVEQDILISTVAQDIKVTSARVATFESITGPTNIISGGAVAIAGSSITLTAASMGFVTPSGGSPSIVLGDPGTATQNLIRGTQYTASEAVLMTSLGLLAVAIEVALPAVSTEAGNFAAALLVWEASLISALNSTVLID